MPDTREKFSHVTLAFHWVLGLTIIGLLIQTALLWFLRRQKIAAY